MGELQKKTLADKKGKVFSDKESQTEIIDDESKVICVELATTKSEHLIENIDERNKVIQLTSENSMLKQKFIEYRALVKT